MPRAAVAAFAAECLESDIVSIEEIPAGLGLRRFYRIHLRGAPGSVIARVEAAEDPAGRPANTAPEPPLEPLRSYLEQHGLPVPHRLGGDANLGIELHEDCGDLTLERAAALAPEHRTRWTRRVVDTLPHLQSVPADPAIPAFGRHLDEALFLYKAELFQQWSLPTGLGRPATPGEATVVREAFLWIARSAADAPQRLAHRDLQSRNLLLSAPTANARITWIDLQGAFLAPPEYDLVCLLRDSYLPTPEPEVDTLLRDVAAALPDVIQPSTLRRRFDLLTLTRKGKDHARFLVAATTRGQTAELAHLPATARMLHRAAEACAGFAPELSRLADLIQTLPEHAS
ncbi:MAG: phosphotransferase [Deltaproteobacteria bacterium]|nr:phosphotransferase [Deltaproteobacteria bacterium]MBW2395051.1 phosphotransferase [Deltaproteobacteria bacterium]